MPTLDLFREYMIVRTEEDDISVFETEEFEGYEEMFGAFRRAYQDLGNFEDHQYSKIKGEYIHACSGLERIHLPAYEKYVMTGMELYEYLYEELEAGAVTLNGLKKTLEAAKEELVRCLLVLYRGV